MNNTLHKRKEVCHEIFLSSRLKVHLHKKEPNMWPLVIIGNTKGEMVMSEEQVAEIHQRLEHLTAEQWVSQLYFFFFLLFTQIDFVNYTLCFSCFLYIA